MSMKVLHLEDDVFKHYHIKEVLNECGIKNIDWVTDLYSGMRRIEESVNDDPYDLIITDMYYPESPMSKKDEEMSGELLIRKLSEQGIRIPVILCSSVNFKYDDIYGTVFYSERNDWEAELRGLVRRLQ